MLAFGNSPVAAEYLWVAAWLTVMVLSVRAAAVEGLDPRSMFVATLFGLAGTLIGGSLLAALDRDGGTSFSLSGVLAAEKSVIGAFIGGGLAATLYLVGRRLDVMGYAEAMLAAVFAGYAVGRIGCLFSGCCFGMPTELPWGLSYPPNTEPYLWQLEHGLIDSSARASLPVHPTQLYHSLVGTLGAVLLMRLERAPRGTRLAVALAMYGACRFGIEFLRADTRPLIGTLDGNQLLAMGMVMSAAALALFMWRRGATAH